MHDLRLSPDTLPADLFHNPSLLWGKSMKCRAYHAEREATGQREEDGTEGPKCLRRRGNEEETGERGRGGRRLVKAESSPQQEVAIICYLIFRYISLRTTPLHALSHLACHRTCSGLNVETWTTSHQYTPFRKT